MATLTDFVVSTVFALADATVPIPLPYISSIPLLPFLHAILVSQAYRNILKENHVRIGWFQGLVAIVMMSAGGGCTVSLLRGEPLGILRNDTYWAIYGGVYWATFSNEIIFEIINAIPQNLLQPILITADGILRGIAVAKVGVDGVRLGDIGPGKYVAMLLCGTLCGGGGGIWADAFRLTQHTWSFSTPRVLMAPGVDLKASFVVALFYMLSTSAELFPEGMEHHALKPVEAQAWSAVIMSGALLYRLAKSQLQQKIAGDVNVKVVEEKEKEQ
ncbi:hypothetical protein INT43_001204 [Umbelopsis isabellina]|uniref:Uncharacterized protein n=1 Tax=Mortierella isabellina TaxID=91625 RepID=A0A8H7PK74_MORIS|nr:hypothetical protein INT43_001204 [Umbelopsis isabellina]